MTKVPEFALAPNVRAYSCPFCWREVDDEAGAVCDWCQAIRGKMTDTQFLQWVHRLAWQLLTPYGTSTEYRVKLGRPGKCSYCKIPTTGNLCSNCDIARRYFLDREDEEKFYQWAICIEVMAQTYDKDGR